MNKLKIKLGDTVKVLTGKDKGKVGKVLKVFPALRKLKVSGINLVKKHKKPSKTQEGGIVHEELPLDVSNVAYFNEKEKSSTKIGYKFDEKLGKVRYSKKTGEVIEGDK